MKRRLAFSQDEPQGPPLFPDPAVLSQDTLHGAMHEALVKEPKKTGRKRPNKKRAFDSSSQPVPGTKSNPPHRVQDKVPILNWHTVHHLAKPMLPPNYVELLTGPMRSLHDGVLFLEQQLLNDKHPSYPLFTVKVPEKVGFVTEDHGDLFHIRFNDVFDMYHMNALHPSIVRLFALSMAYRIALENTPDIFVIDPYYMKEMSVNSYSGKVRVIKFIEDCFVNNPTKNTFLLPYFPE